jgi:hypothetical protein
MKIYEVIHPISEKLTVDTIDQIFLEYTSLLENKSSEYRSLVEKLQNILTGKQPEFKNVKISIKGSALKSILNKKEPRVITTILEFLDEFRSDPVAFENRMVNEKKMRAHRIKLTKNKDKETNKSTKVDILGKNLGLLFHSGPKTVDTTKVEPNELYIVAFGSHSDLGT